MIHQYQPQTSSSNRGKSLDLLYFGSILLSIHLILIFFYFLLSKTRIVFQRVLPIKGEQMPSKKRKHVEQDELLDLSELGDD